MKVLIVYAHPEPKSFNYAMKELAVTTLREGGHEVKVSDVNAMDFNPVASANDFLGRMDSGYLNYLLEQRNASRNNSFLKDIVDEQEKVRWAALSSCRLPSGGFLFPPF